MQTKHSEQDKSLARNRLDQIHAEPFNKDEVYNLLYNYKANRASIVLILETIEEDSDMLLYPSGVDLTKDKVSQDPSDMIETFLRRARSARTYQVETLKLLRDCVRILDKLMYCVTKLPSHERLAVMETTINGKSAGEVGDEHGLSARTVKRHKHAGVERVYNMINKPLKK